MVFDFAKILIVCDPNLHSTQSHLCYSFEGPTPNTMLSINRDEPSANIHRVMYSAKDSAGLDARTPCTFYITIAGIDFLFISFNLC